MAAAADIRHLAATEAAESAAAMPTEQPGETPTAGDVPCGLHEGGGRAQLKRKRNGDDDAEFDADVDSNTGGAADSESEASSELDDDASDTEHQPSRLSSVALM